MDLSPKLPNEIWLIILGFLEKDTLKNVCDVNKRLRDLAMSKRLQKIEINLGVMRGKSTSCREQLSSVRRIGQMEDMSRTRFPHLQKQITKLNLEVGYDDFEEQFKSFVTSSPPSLFDFFPNLRFVNITVVTMDFLDTVTLYALFDYVSSHSDRSLVTIDISFHNNNTDHIQPYLQSLEHLHGLSELQFSFPSLKPIHVNYTHQYFAKALLQSPHLEATSIEVSPYEEGIRGNGGAEDSRYVNMEDILSKLPDNFVLSNLKQLTLFGVIPPSTPDQARKVPFLDFLYIDRYPLWNDRDVAIFKTESMSRIFAQAGCHLSELHIDYVSHELFDYLVSDVATRYLKTLEIGLLNDAHELGCADKEANELLSRMLWERVVPHIFTYLETFTLGIEALTAKEVNGKVIPSTSKWDTDPHLWSIQRLVPYIDNIGPTKLRTLRVMVDTNDEDNEWASDTGTIFRHIMRNNICNLSTGLSLMIMIHDRGFPCSMKEIYKAQIKNQLNGVLENDSNQATYLRLETNYNIRSSLEIEA